MCRAGKDKTKRICPANTLPEKIAEKNELKRLRYQKSKVSGMVSQLAAQAESLTPEELSAKQKNLGLTASNVSYKNHIEYAHKAIDTLRTTGKETHLVFANVTSGGELIWDKERAVIHRQIIQEQLAAWEDVPCEGEAIFSGGWAGPVRVLY